MIVSRTYFYVLLTAFLLIAYPNTVLASGVVAQQVVTGAQTKITDSVNNATGIDIKNIDLAGAQTAAEKAARDAITQYTDVDSSNISVSGAQAAAEKAATDALAKYGITTTNFSATGIQSVAQAAAVTQLKNITGVSDLSGLSINNLKTSAQKYLQTSATGVLGGALNSATGIDIKNIDLSGAQAAAEKAARDAITQYTGIDSGNISVAGAQAAAEKAATDALAKYGITTTDFSAAGIQSVAQAAAVTQLKNITGVSDLSSLSVNNLKTSAQEYLQSSMTGAIGNAFGGAFNSGGIGTSTGQTGGSGSSTGIKNVPTCNGGTCITSEMVNASKNTNVKFDPVSSYSSQLSPASKCSSTQNTGITVHKQIKGDLKLFPETLCTNQGCSTDTDGKCQ